MNDKPLRATHGSPDRPLRIGSIEIPCYVLENGMRVLSGRGMQGALALGQAHGTLLRTFLNKESLKPFIHEKLAMDIGSPVRFIRPGQLFRLRGWPYSPLSVKRPQYVGKLTNQLVYEQLPEGVLDDLKRKNPKDEKGRRKHKFFQFLTEDIGNPHLERHIASVTTLMRAAPNWKIFDRLFARAFSKEPIQGDMFEESDDITSE
jgi:hypothetical protein